VPSRKGGSYQKGGGYFSGIEMDVKTRKRLLKKVRGKEVFMAMAYSRGQPVLPPRLQHGVPPGRSPPVHCSQGAGNMAPYGPYHPPNPPQRHNRGFGMTRGSARFINRHNMVGPQIAFYPSPGKRCYQNYDSFSCRSRSYSRSCRQMQCVNKECQYGFVPENGEEPQGSEETITFYEIEEGNETSFPALAVNPDCETAAVFHSAEPTANLVMVNSAVIATSAGVNAAPPTVFSSNSASTQASVTTAVPPQTAIQPVLVSPPSIGRPVSSLPFPIYSAPLPPANEVGEAGAVPPPYSCDPNGSDLPRDTKVLQYYFNLGLQYYHQSYWHSMVYVQPVPPASSVEAYSAYPEPAHVMDQSVPHLYDAGRAEVQHVPLDVPANALSHGMVYYPVVSDPYSQPSAPGFDPCISLVPAYQYIGSWHSLNPPHGNSARVPNAVSSGQLHQVSYVASPNPAVPYVPPGM
uniref:N-acetylglucosaminyldiphosphodolichol N-acetylglucosaminyltransferase n=1 Tax=Coturnix japonica TaxID=93934 RepID=A0A8C2U564_COTJA